MSALQIAKVVVSGKSEFARKRYVPIEELTAGSKGFEDQPFTRLIGENHKRTT